MAVPRELISSIAEAKEYASAAMRAASSVCPAAYDRYSKVYASASVMQQQNFANSPFEGDAVRRLVDDLRAVDGFCADVRKTGSSNPPARTVRGDEPAPMPTAEEPSAPPVPKSPPRGSTTKKPSAGGGTTPQPPSSSIPWWAWGLIGVGAVWLFKKGKKKTRRNPSREKRSSRRRRRR